MNHACDVFFLLILSLHILFHIPRHCNSWSHFFSVLTVHVQFMLEEGYTVIATYCICANFASEFAHISRFRIHHTKLRCVCETLCPRWQICPKTIFSFKVEVKVTRLLTLVSFERASLVEYAYQISEVSISYGSKVIGKVKADMKSYIPLETATIFFLANLFPKQGISSKNVTADFICMGLHGLQGAKTENYKMKNSCPYRDSNSRSLILKSSALSMRLSSLIYKRKFKTSLVEYRCAL